MANKKLRRKKKRMAKKKRSNSKSMGTPAFNIYG